uniref:Uncharacterized protein n=1 Tax=Psilocybe cubensis TaxID=181762 RepID=A0A8H7XM14_PSICU
MFILRAYPLLALAVTFVSAAVLPESEFERRCLPAGSTCFLTNPGVCCTETCTCGISCSIEQEAGQVPAFCATTFEGDIP